jgi:glycine cleavage system H protein
VTQTPEDLHYTEEHEWVQRISPTRVRIGITDYAQSQLGDVVFVQLPEADRDAAAGESIAEVESTKSVSDIYAPLAAKVVAVNQDLVQKPETLNTDPYGEGSTCTGTPWQGTVNANRCAGELFRCSSVNDPRSWR